MNITGRDTDKKIWQKIFLGLKATSLFVLIAVPSYLTGWFLSLFLFSGSGQGLGSAIGAFGAFIISLMIGACLTIFVRILVGVKIKKESLGKSSKTGIFYSILLFSGGYAFLEILASSSFLQYLLL